MKPDPGTVLRGIAKAQTHDLARDLRTPFGQATNGMAASLAMILAAEFDGLVDRLVQENRATAAILAEALPLTDGPLSVALAETVAALEPGDLRVSTVQGINDRFRGLLIDVHAFIEGVDQPLARALESKIWAELQESTLRRQVGHRK
ncbi:MAG: hypothetical protein AB7T37_00895 [Dehalococcoidia bacterium]